MTDGCLNCRLLLSFTCLLAFLVSITLKINQTWSHISWLLIFIPIWFFNCISLCIIFYLIVIKKWLKTKETCLKIVYYLLSLTSSCAFEILLCVKLQYKRDMPYWIVFLPMWIFIFLLFNIITQQMYRTCQTTTGKTL
ncbi:hypothetical protein I4U23_025972 [Adineta vaga]|nr:hypothetical protein I4U23_025972 [Adineta vaga]